MKKLERARRMEAITVKLPAFLLNEVNKLAEVYGSRSELIRDALVYYMITIKRCMEDASEA